MDQVTGAYVVTTATAFYVIDLDEMFILRQPAATGTSSLPDDDQTLALLAIRECTVGRPMVVRLGLPTKDASSTDRTTSIVLAIDDWSAARRRDRKVE